MIELIDLVISRSPPQKATKCANGSLPTNGFRYCEPVRTASGFGWSIFLPHDVWLMWDGSEVEWSLNQGTDWFPLGDAIQHPGFSKAFDEVCPKEIAGYAPPFLSRTNDNDILQIWPGTIVRTPPGVSAWVRGPVNQVRPQGIDILEGVIQTDRWFGPLFTNIRLRRQGAPLILRASKPFLQVLPFSRAFAEEMGKMPVTAKQGLAEMSAKDWAAYKNTVVRRMKTRERLGEYAVEARKADAGMEI